MLTERFVANQFQHVMVLVSIIIGLGITHLLSGVGGVIERVTQTPKLPTFGFAHAIWVLNIFFWMVTFWWFEYRLLTSVKSWTLGLYSFIILYSVLLYLLSIILVPRDWSRVGDLDAYFIARRHWFFSIYLMANAADVVDTFLKGGVAHFRSVGVVTNLLTAATVPIVVVGIRSTNVRTHAILSCLVLIGALVAITESFPTLGP